MFNANIKYLFVFVLYLSITCYVTKPLINNMHSSVGGDRLDSVLVVWILGWNFQSFDDFSFDHYLNTNMFHPEPNTLFFSETFTFPALVLYPLYKMGFSLAFCYNVMCLLLIALACFAAYLIAYDISNNQYISFLGGTIFGLTTFHLMAFHRPQLLFSGLLLLSIRNLLCFLNRKQYRYLAYYALFTVFQLTCCVYYVAYNIFFSLICLAVCIYRGFSKKHLTIFIAVLCVLFTIIFAYYFNYYKAIISQGLITFNYQEYVFRICNPTLAHIVWPSKVNYVLTNYLPPILAYFSDNCAFPGFIALALSLAYLYTFLKPYGIINFFKQYSVLIPSIAFFALLVGLVMYLAYIPLLNDSFQFAFLTFSMSNTPHLMSFGLLVLFYIVVGQFLWQHHVLNIIKTKNLSMVLLSLAALFAVFFYNLYPLRWLIKTFPMLSALRIQGRWIVLILIWISVASVLGYIKLTNINRISKYLGYILLPLVCFGVIVECKTDVKTFEIPVKKEDIPEVYQWLSMQEEYDVIAELPDDFYSPRAIYIYYSLFHNKKLVNGYSGYKPLWYTEFISKTKIFPSKAAYQVLKNKGVSLVIIHHDFPNFKTMETDVKDFENLSVVYQDEKAIAVKLE